MKKKEQNGKNFIEKGVFDERVWKILIKGFFNF